MSNRVYYSQEAEEEAKKRLLLATVLFVGVGATIGAILALMFAPNEGEKIRRDISDSLSDGADAGREATNNAVKRLEKQFDDLRQRVEDRIN